MTVVHEANSTPAGRKPLKDWTRTPEQEAAHQRMLAKCQARAQPVETAEDRPAPLPVVPTHPPQLVWNRKSKYAMQSGCTTYEIHKKTVGNFMRNGMNISDGRTVYRCWRKVQQLWYIEFDVYRDSYAEAQEVCEKHARENPIGGKVAA